MNRIAISAIAATVALNSTPQAEAGVRVGVVIASDRGVYNDRDGYRGRYNVERIAYDNGYRDGIREGEKDDRRDDRFNYRDEGRYRDGDAGYRREYGPKYEYVSAYRAVDPRESRHRQGRAFDFRIPGVPLTELRDYVWTHHTEIGVGWYPQSNFIHMDHRPGDKDYAWTQIGATEHGNPYWATKARRAEPAPERPRRGAGS